MIENNFDEKFSEDISDLCIKIFTRLGKTGKPVNDEWIVTACVIKAEHKNGENNMEVVSLGTGSKCIGGSQLPRKGDRLHDSHAEVIARRGFKLYLLEQLKLCLESGTSVFVIEDGEFVLKKNITFHFYCSNVPCGDASIFPKCENSAIIEPTAKTKTLEANEDNQYFNPLTISSLDSTVLNVKGSVGDKMHNHRNHFAVPKICNPLENFSEPSAKKIKFDTEIKTFVNDVHRTGAKCTLNELLDPKEDGLSYHITGPLRTKPGRGDPTLSHCCSDKIFKWTVLGMQGALLMLFLNTPIYVETVTIGAGPFNHDALLRAFYTRFEKDLSSTDLILPFKIKTPKIRQASVPFPFSKSFYKCSVTLQMKPSPTSIIWIAASVTATTSTKSEVSVEGKKLGASKKNENSPKSRVSICRIEMMRKCLEVVDLIRKKCSSGELTFNRLMELSSVTDLLTYHSLKDESSGYKKMWTILRDCVLFNWTTKPGDIKDFVVDCLQKKQG